MSKEKFPAAEQATDEHPEFTYSVPVEEEYGRFPVWIAKVLYIVVLARVRIKQLFLPPDNPRLWNEKNCDKFSFTAGGQKNIRQALTEGSMEGASDRLRNSLEYHGGQNEAVWAYAPNGKRPQMIEGSRRRATFEKLHGEQPMEKWETMTTYVFPDQLTADHASQLMSRRHLAEVERWASAVRSRVAYEYMNGELGGIEGDTPDERLGNIVKLMQFDSLQQAEKFIHSYVWWKESGRPASDWSKFYHAYVPRLVRYFGYDKVSMTFKQDQRSCPDQPKTQNGKRLPERDVAEIDNIVQKASEKAARADKVDYRHVQPGFKWFCQLIVQKKVTDCRHSDGIIAPALSVADKPYGPRVLETLHRTNKSPGKKRDAEDDGKGALDQDSPAQLAWNYLREARKENHLVSVIQATHRTIGDVLDSSSKMSDYRKSNPDNRGLRASMSLLMADCEKFLARTKDAEAKEEPA